MEEKAVINEESFYIEINKWDDFTLGLLKSYSDWKCNENQVPAAPPVDVPVTIETQSESDNQTNLNQRQTTTKKDISPLFPELQSLVKPGEYGFTPIYGPILEYILKSLPDKFSKKEVSELIYNFYNEIGRDLKLASASVYGSSYCNYMIDRKIISEADGSFVKVKKNQNLKVKS